MMNGLAIFNILIILIIPCSSHTSSSLPHSTSKTRMRQHMEPSPSRNLTQQGQPQQTYLGYNGDIIYPDMMPEAGKHLQPKKDNSKKDSKENCIYGLCYGRADYPKTKIKSLLSRTEYADNFFIDTEDSIDLINRFGTDEEFMCETQQHSIYPEKANNTNKIEKTIVNVEGHKQGIVFETCLHNEKCKFSEFLPNGFTSYCKQKYVVRRLMVFSQEEKFVFDKFEIPSCCVCAIKHN